MPIDICLKLNAFMKWRFLKRVFFETGVQKFPATGRVFFFGGNTAGLSHKKQTFIDEHGMRREADGADNRRRQEIQEGGKRRLMVVLVFGYANGSSGCSHCW